MPVSARIAMYSSWVLNPYQELLVRELRALDLHVREQGLADLATIAPADGLAAVHVHGLPFRLAPDRRSLARVGAVLRRLAALRRSGTEVLWTPHDFAPHRAVSRGASAVDRAVRRILARIVTTVHVHSERERDGWRRAGVAPHKLLLAPHGHYVGYYPDQIGVAEARAALGVGPNDLVFGFFGWLRRNKGLVELLDAFAHLDDDGARLLVSGTPEDGGIADEIARWMARDPRIVARIGPVPTEEVQLHLRAADVMMFPYRASVATSGAAVLAASFARPCIATRTANLPALLPEDSNVFFDDADPQALLDAMRTAAKQRDALPAWGLRNRERVLRDDWSTTAGILRDAYLRRR